MDSMLNPSGGAPRHTAGFALPMRLKGPFGAAAALLLVTLALDVAAQPPADTAPPASEVLSKEPPPDAAATEMRSPGDASTGVEAPAAIVEELQRALLAYMSAAREVGGLPDGPVRDRLRDAVLATHDFAYISRVVLGRLWRDLDEQDRQRFIERFTSLSLATYADRFADFEGDTFTVTGEGEGRFGQRRISANLVSPDRQRSFEYLLRQNDGAWRIVNIIVDGVSDLALRHAEYTSFVQDNGFPALLTELERQRDELLSDSATG